jgi:2-oxoisovalerate dehydrogenase E1 component beta subunit
MVMATSLRRCGRRLVSSVFNNREFSTTFQGNKAIQQQHEQLQETGKSLNLCSAINQALHIALETDPRYVSSNTHFIFLFLFGF